VWGVGLMTSSCGPDTCHPGTLHRQHSGTPHWIGRAVRTILLCSDLSAALGGGISR
jgi:hypothetical protein